MYFVPYQPDVQKALEELRAREFMAGRYFPATDNLWTLLPIGPDSPAPGARHASIEAALDASGDSGTRSILDIIFVSATPRNLAVSPIDRGTLEMLYGTTQPTREMVMNQLDLFEGIERGQGVYTVIYREGIPQEIMFAGYSFD
jgi:hypothetical protein